MGNWKMVNTRGVSALDGEDNMHYCLHLLPKCRTSYSYKECVHITLPVISPRTPFPVLKGTLVYVTILSSQN